MLEEKYFEKFKNLGKYLAYADILDIINYLLETNNHPLVIDVLDDLRKRTILRTKESLEKC